MGQERRICQSLRLSVRVSLPPSYASSFYSLLVFHIWKPKCRLLWSLIIPKTTCNANWISVIFTIKTDDAHMGPPTIQTPTGFPHPPPTIAASSAEDVILESLKGLCHVTFAVFSSKLHKYNSLLPLLVGNIHLCTREEDLRKMFTERSI